MHYFLKTFDLLLSELYASAFARDRDFIKRLVEEDRICHSCVLVVELQAYHQVRQLIHWAMRVIMPPNHLKLDDGHCAPVLVQLVVQGADSNQMEDRYTKYAIHSSWKVLLFLMVDVHRNQIKENQRFLLKLKISL